MNTDIHERAKVGDVGHHTFEHHLRAKIGEIIYTFSESCRLKLRAWVSPRLLQLSQDVADRR